MIKPLKYYNMGQDRGPMLEEWIRAYSLVFCGELGLDPTQVTRIDETESDASGNVVVTWQALIDQPVPALGTEIETRTRVPATPEQWSGQVLLGADDVASLRAKTGGRPTQDDVDAYLERERQVAEEWWEV